MTNHNKNSDPTAVDKTVLFTPDNEESAVDADSLRRDFSLKPSSDTNPFGDVSILAEGGVGLILKGFDSNLGREIAIKVLRPGKRSDKNAVRRFIREARATAQIDHPNVVPVHELGVHPELGVYFTMRKIGGEPLSTIIQRLRAGNPEYEKKYSLSQLMHLFTDVGNGVAYAHSKGIIHRDLKPDNIFIGDFGEVIIIDWGLVRNLENPGSHSSEEGPARRDSASELNIDIDDKLDKNLTKDGHISGTPCYMSPEQALGENSKIDHRSDIYTLGIILYQMLTLKLPFEGEDVPEIMNKILEGKFLPPRQVSPKRHIPAELEAICEKAMSHKPEDRYQSVNELLKDIYNYFDDFPVSALKHTLLGRFRKFCLRHKLASVAVITLLITIGAALGLHDEFMKMRYGPLYDTAQKSIQRSMSDIDSAAALLERTKKHATSTAHRSPATCKEDELCSEAERRADENANLALLLLDTIPADLKNSPDIKNAYAKLLDRQIRYYSEKKDFAKVKRLKQRLKQLREE